MKIILASTSPYRKAQLENAGFLFEAVSPAVNETSLKEIGPQEPVALCEYLARAKATSLKFKFPDSIILGCDQMVEFQGARLDKPGDRPHAVAQLLRMQGQTHRLITALFLWSSSREHHWTDITEITLRKMSRKAAEEYVDRDQPFDCAGSYKIERAGMCLVEKIKTEDPSAIQGVSLRGLTQMLLDHGILLEKIWEKRNRTV